MITAKCCPKCGETNLDTPGEHFICAHWTPVADGVVKYLTKVPPEYSTWTETEQRAFWAPVVKALQEDATRAAIDPRGPKGAK